MCNVTVVFTCVDTVVIVWDAENLQLLLLLLIVIAILVIAPSNVIECADAMLTTVHAEARAIHIYYLLKTLSIVWAERRQVILLHLEWNTSLSLCDAKHYI